ncbi:MAG: CvpA family protein [Albidovulum sp.]|nr:CvpA family protein [Albidovulum sp.]MDE0306963.1 CvpA family protein [Albidovulum sp.]MDE0532645.1 CvpA family protein [Albidovulum sp.]
MDGFNLFDGVAAVIVLISALLAFSRGFIREIMSIVGWIVAAVGAYALAPGAAPHIANLPYVGDFLGESCELAIIAAFILLFAVCLVIVSFIGSLFGYLAKHPAFSAVDKVAGFIFGAARGVLLVAIILILNDKVLPAGQAFEIIKESEFQQGLAAIQRSIEEQLPSDATDMIERTYQSLMVSCRSPADLL